MHISRKFFSERALGLFLVGPQGFFNHSGLVELVSS